LRTALLASRKRSDDKCHSDCKQDVELSTNAETKKSMGAAQRLFTAAQSQPISRPYKTRLWLGTDFGLSRLREPP
jgi:hypothetical protein